MSPISSGKKVLYVIGICAVVTALCLFMTAVMPTIIELIGFAQADPSLAGGDYPAYEAALGAAPMWIYLIPILVAGIAVVLVLKAPER